jgi:hypothetical protein
LDQNPTSYRICFASFFATGRDLAVKATLATILLAASTLVAETLVEAARVAIMAFFAAERFVIKDFFWIVILISPFS